MPTPTALPSIQSLYVEAYFDDQRLGKATGFVVDTQGGPVFVTNWHVVTGKNPLTKKHIDEETLGEPNRLKIFHNGTNLDEHVPVFEPLYNDGNPLWLEHPVHRENVDVVALPLTHLDGIKLFPHSITEHQDLYVEVPDRVSVVGFPFGMRTAGAKALWATGHVASEIAEDFEGLPAFLVDCRSREGQSGSPVIAYGNTFADRNSFAIHEAPKTRLMGVYSGRVNAGSDLGKVWKPKALSEIIALMPWPRNAKT